MVSSRQVRVRAKCAEGGLEYQAALNSESNTSRFHARAHSHTHALTPCLHPDRTSSHDCVCAVQRVCLCMHVDQVCLPG